ncbi:MAG: carbohydrate ABC transporter permease [Clostridia bacterium]|nr:carbohydrate ABC transporter permease [Clostridia bacterium]
MLNSSTIKTKTADEYRAEAKRARIVGGLKTAGVYTMLTLWAIAVLFPFFWMLLTSFKTFGSYNAERIPSFIIRHATLDNYISAFTEVNLGGYILNTLVFTVVTTLLMVVVSVLAAYAFSRLNFKGKEIVFTLFLALMMIPSELVVITNFVTITEMGLRNTFTGLILPSVTSIFYIYLLRENFSQIPDNLYLAAKVDGTGDLKYLWRVVLPICKPTVITVLILKAIECWNSFVWPRLITDNEAYFLISQGIQTIRESGFGRENVPAMMAAVVIVSLPLIVLFIIFRNKIMEGVARGGSKG